MELWSYKMNTVMARKISEGTSYEEFEEKIKTSFIEKTRNGMVGDILSKNFSIFFPEPATFVIENQLNRDENKLRGSQVDEIFYKMILDDPENLLQVISKEVAKEAQRVALNRKHEKNLKSLLSELFTNCVEQDKAKTLEKLLEWIQNPQNWKLENVNTNSVYVMFKNWHRDDRDNGAKGFTFNSSAMIRACEKNDHQMVSFFMEACIDCDGTEIKFDLEDQTFQLKETKKRKKFTQWLEDNSKMFIGEYERDKKDILSHYRIFYATSTPAYLIAKFKKSERSDSDLHSFDPVSEAYAIMETCEYQALQYEEYEEKFKSIKRMLKQFTVKILNCCEKIDEAKLLMSTDTKTKVCRLKYPRINVAIQKYHEDFVSHDYCQQILREEWLRSQYSKKIIQWHSTGYFDQGLYVFSCVILMPFHLILYPFARFLKRESEVLKDREGGNTNHAMPREENCCSVIKNFLIETSLHFTYPINRFIANILSFLVFLSLLVVLAIEYLPSSENNFDFRLRWCDYLIIIYGFGFLGPEFSSIYKYFHKKRFPVPALLWPIFNATAIVCIIGSRFTKLYGSENTSPSTPKILRATKMNTSLSSASLETSLENICRIHGFVVEECTIYHIISIGYCLLGVGSTMLVLKLFYYFVLDRRMGPVSISIRKLIKV